MLGQENRLDLGTAAGQLASGFHAVERGHADIHYHHIRREGFSVFDGFASVGRLRDNLQSFALKQGLNALSD